MKKKLMCTICLLLIAYPGGYAGAAEDTVVTETVEVNIAVENKDPNDEQQRFEKAPFYPPPANVGIAAGAGAAGGAGVYAAFGGVGLI